MAGGGRDAGTMLARAIGRDAVAAGCAVTLAATRSVPWVSATFTGARHGWAVSCPGACSGAAHGGAIERWLARLPDTELRVPGHLVADIVVARGDAGVTIEALVLEAG